MLVQMVKIQTNPSCHKKERYMARAYSNKIDELSEKFRKGLSNFNSSGHAFLLFDSPHTVLQVEKMLK